MTLLRKAVAASALILTVTVSFSSFADTFTLVNDNGGDGFVNTFPGGFDLFGSDDGSVNNPIPNTATYSATALTNQTFFVTWTYHTNDSGVPGVALPPFFDPAGYVLNGVLTQLTDDNGLNDQNGSFIATIVAGDIYGMYVFSTDSCCGRADILVTISDTPLPAALPLFGSALGAGGLFWLRRRNRR